MCSYSIPVRDKRRNAFGSNFSFLSDSRIRSDGLTIEWEIRRLAQIGDVSRSDSDGKILYLVFTDWWRWLLGRWSLSRFVVIVLERFRVDLTLPNIGSYSISTSTIFCAIHRKIDFDKKNERFQCKRTYYQFLYSHVKCHVNLNEHKYQQILWYSVQ